MTKNKKNSNNLREYQKNKILFFLHSKKMSEKTLKFNG